ncbi:MAG TPA: DUF72 domain-containing protein [Nitrososphaeraceae archaeon]|jgi:uncharacterized protein YecE (DUF72 family)|nr:DUF72 domain-containing protein [Nitrososphaeraceae archaeon]
MKLYVGCSGWSYTSWKGPFYPSKMENKLWLPYYSQIFNYVEIDSTFYNIPSELMVRNWRRRTPDSFRFTAKFPKIITHEKRFKHVEKDLELFYERMEPIKDKVLALLIQLPPSYQLKQGLEDFRNYNFFFEGSFRYAVEVRHPSWFNELAYNFFKRNNIAMVWSQMDRLYTPPIVTSDFVYLRLIGDRRLAESQFGKIQIDRTEQIKNWANKMKEVKQNEKDVKAGIVAANNHYGGYGPGTVDTFRENMDMEKLSFENVDIAKINRQIQLETRFTLSGRKRSGKGKQTTLSDFVN